MAIKNSSRGGEVFQLTTLISPPPKAGVGVGTASCGPVAGLRRAVPSTALDKSACLFQAEDGIRDDLVTGVQTCALPISTARSPRLAPRPSTPTAGQARQCR